MKYVWSIFLILIPFSLMADIGEFNYHVLDPVTWEVRGNVSFYHQNDMLPSTDIDFVSAGIEGFYTPLEGVYAGGSWRSSLISYSYPERGTLKTVGDISLWGLYNIYAYKGINFWIGAGLFLFAPVEDESNYGDTSSYLIDATVTYVWHKLFPILTIGYFYDRRVNFTDRQPDDLERIAWNQVDYTWSYVSPGLLYRSEEYALFVGYRKEILFSSDASFREQPSYLYNKIDLTISRHLSLGISARWKLFSHSVQGYPKQPWVMVTSLITYRPSSTQLPKTQRPQAQIPENNQKGSLTVKILNEAPGFKATLNGIEPDYIEGNVLKFLQLVPGKYTLSVEAPGFVAMTTGVTIGKGETRELEISLKPEIKPASIMGVVVSNGVPVPNARIEISGEVTRTVSSDGEGVFQIDDIPPGSYAISVTAPDYQQSTIYLELSSGEKKAIRVNIKEIEYPHAIINLLIKDKKGNALKEYSFKVEAERFKVLKREPGRLQLYVAPGEVTITISAPGMKQKKLLFTLDDGDEITSSVKMKER